MLIVKDNPSKVYDMCLIYYLFSYFYEMWLLWTFIWTHRNLWSL